MLEFERVQNTFQGTEGCYVIKNNTKDKIYVGQSKNLA
jgi:excinuclease UvrABC nuclease subunit